MLSNTGGVEMGSDREVWYYAPALCSARIESPSIAYALAVIAWRHKHVTHPAVVVVAVDCACARDDSPCYCPP
jgi:hypothetical protein